MKKSTKIMAIALAVLMVFGVTTVAFANESDGFPNSYWNQSMFGVLRVGSERNSVFGCQRVVGSSADGIFGSGTQSAVKTYQRNWGLSADGVVGSGTWSSFRDRLGATEVTAVNVGYTLTGGGARVFVHWSDGNWEVMTRNGMYVDM